MNESLHDLPKYLSLSRTAHVDDRFDIPPATRRAEPVEHDAFTGNHTTVTNVSFRLGSFLYVDMFSSAMRGISSRLERNRDQSVCVLYDLIS